MIDTRYSVLIEHTPKKTQETLDMTEEQKEMMIEFLKNNRIVVCAPVQADDIRDNPIRPKGRQMPGQEMGCLRVPHHGGC